jgi:hypothetical protein
MEWLSLEETAIMLGVDVRSVYRMLGKGQLQSNGEKRGRKVLKSSVEEMLTKRLAEVATKDIDTGAVSQESDQESKSLARRDNRAAVMALQAIQNDRDKLYDRLEALHELRRQESITASETIGQLTERVKNLEAQLQAAQAARAAQPAPKPPTPVDNSPRAEIATEPPQKITWRQRLFGLR